MIVIPVEDNGACSMQRGFDFAKEGLYMPGIDCYNYCRQYIVDFVSLIFTESR